MLFCALASDYDGTLARDGRVDEATLEALRRFKASGKRLILITGRELTELRAVFRRTDDFDAVAAENGALLYLPATKADPAESRAQIAEAIKRRYAPASVG